MKIKSEKGQAMVEFALVLIPLLIIVGGIIDFGWIFYHQVMINNAAREGARYAAIHSKESTYEVDTITEVNKRLPTTLIKSRVGLVPIAVVENSPSTGDVTVIVKGDIDILTPFISIIFTDSYPLRNGKQKELSAQTIMKME